MKFSIMILLVCLGLFLLFLLTNKLTKELFVILAVFSLIAFISDLEARDITLEEAEILAYDKLRQFQKEGIIESGNIRRIVEAEMKNLVFEKSNVVENYYTVILCLDKTPKRYFLFKIDKKGKFLGWTEIRQKVSVREIEDFVKIIPAKYKNKKDVGGVENEKK